MNIRHTGKLHHSAVALGMFDGVHTGHRAVISDCVKYAKAHDLTSVVYSFDSHPRTLLAGTVSILTPNEEKTSLISALGADCLYLEPLSGEFLSLSPEEFIQTVLAEKLDAKYVVCGYNYRFGKGGQGSAETLREAGKTFGFTVSVIPETTVGGVSVSSSAIRKALANGDIQTATALLGRPFSFCGRVAVGRKVGHKLGFPTLNIPLPDAFPTLRFGVYGAYVTLLGGRYPAMVNIGVHPTFEESAPQCEAHLFGYDGDAYGEIVTVELADFIRPEKKFDSPDSLIAQIGEDKKKVIDSMEKL